MAREEDYTKNPQFLELEADLAAEHDENARLRSDLFLARQAEVEACQQRDKLREELKNTQESHEAAVYGHGQCEKNMDAEINRLREDRDNWMGVAQNNARESARLREELIRSDNENIKFDSEIGKLRDEIEVYRNAYVGLRQMNEAIKADSEEAWNENAKLRERKETT